MVPGLLSLPLVDTYRLHLDCAWAETGIPRLAMSMAIIGTRKSNFERFIIPPKALSIYPKIRKEPLFYVQKTEGFLHIKK
jgi:hypothetical protein